MTQNETADKPLLSIAIPTYNRAGLLQTMLEILVPQLAGEPRVELIVCDNGSPDGTAEVMRGFIEQGLQVRYIRHETNIGSDENFVHCFEAARGKYFWMCGDDDILLPGAVGKVLGHLAKDEYDLIYVTLFAYRGDYVGQREEDPLGRRWHTITDARRMAKVTSIMFTLITVIIVNRDRLMEVPHEAPRSFIGTNLVQLSWSLPLLLHHRKSMVIWERLVAGRQGNAGGYSVGSVFGEKLKTVVERVLPGRDDLRDEILNFTVRRWFPEMLYGIRSSGNTKMGLAEAQVELKKTYGGNFRYWMYVYPVLVAPLPIAKLWWKGGAVVSKAIYVLLVPGFWRKET